MKEAPLYEVFSSLQGEGPRVGERHLFVRFSGCDLECAYCDTPASRRVPEHARIFLPDWTHEVPNPLDRESLDDWVMRLEEAAGPHHAVALTGGEPLLHAGFWKPLAAAWRARGLEVLLETGGHRPGDLAAVLDAVDVVMADVKIASSAGVATEPETVGAFLEQASARECAAKVVVNARTTAEELRIVAELVPEGVPLILQPVSGGKFEPPDGAHCLDLQRAALAIHRDTRVIPQIHRLLHLR